MATAVPENWNALSVSNPTLGNPADLGAYRGLLQERGAVYDTRANDQWDWARKQFEKNAATADQVQKQALDTGAMFNDWAKADRSLWDTKGVPGLTAQMDTAMDWASPGRIAANRANAVAGNNITFDAAADMARRALMGYGVDPSAGRFAGLDAGLAAKRAASAAGVARKSDLDTELTGQALLDRANARFAVLPGQAANEAGVGLAAGNQAVNTGLATTTSGAQTMGTGLQWAGMGDDLVKEWADSLLKQTTLGMQQNRDAAEQRMAQAKLDQSSSSGIGAMIGAGAGILGSVLGGPAGGMLGSTLGKAVGSGWIAEKGGKIERFQRGGMVLDEQGDPIREPEFDPEGEGYDYDQARAAGMGPDEDGHWQSREPGSGMMLKGRKHPTFDKGVEEDRRKGYGLEKQNGRYYTRPFQRYAEGGSVDPLIKKIYGEDVPLAFAEGGGVPDDEDMESMMVDTPEEEMMEGEVPNMVPPEASPSGGEETDDVHALLNEGEFVIPKDVTSWYGEKYFQNLIQRAYKEKQAAQAKPEEASPQQQQAIAMSPPSFETMGA